jgi:TonB-linked SusC/RagA family outer membrane protein
MKTKPFFESLTLLKLLPTLVFCLSMTAFVYGQISAVEIQGTVTDSEGVPLTGASVIVVGTQNGTVTDFDGNFKLSFNSRNLSVHGGNYLFLEASYVGYKDQRLEIGNQTTFNFTLSIDNLLSETIVTAQGITREKRSIGYGVSTITAEELSDRPYTDLAQALNGKISGVNISTLTGKSSEEARVEVRTQLSLVDDRDPLLIVDNIPYHGNLADINIDDVKLITVLKGLSATTLYGNEGRNGVILVETKSNDQEGDRGVRFTLTQRYYTNRVATLPAYQNQYGPGRNLEFNQDAVDQFRGDGHFGPHFDDIDFVPHPLSEYHGDDFPEYANAMVPYEAKPDNVSKMFNPSFGSNTTFSTTARGERSLLNSSFGYVNEGGIFGKDHLERFTFNINGQTQITDKFTVRARVNYTDRATLDNLNNPLQDIVNLPRNIDLTEFPYEHPVDGTSVSYRRRAANPLWEIENTQNKRQTNNFGLNLVLDYVLSPHLDLTYRGGYSRTNTSNKSDSNNPEKRSENISGGFTRVSSSNSLSFNQTLILSLDRINLNKKMGINAQLGINSSQSKGKSVLLSAVGQLIHDDFNPEHFSEFDAGFSRDRSNSAGAFIQSTLNYENHLYLTLSGRNEWGSTVEPEHQSIFFPSASLSFIPSSLFDMHSPVLSFLKLRAAFASTTGFPSSYQTRPYLELSSDRFSNDDRIIQLRLPTRFANFDLKPELHEEIELGLETLLWQDRIDLIVSAYKRISTDLIQETSTSPSTGYESATVNLGKVESKGLEIDLDIHMVKSQNFNYKIINRFNTHETILKESHPLASDRDFLVGESLTAIEGTYPIRDDEGNLLISPNSGEIITNHNVGLPDKIIGDSRFKWRVSNIQQVSYKQFAFETQIEYSHGGDQITNFFFEGALKNSVKGREDGYVIEGILGDRKTGLPILDAEGNKIKNTQILSSYGAVRHSDGPDTFDLWDRSHFRIRDLVLHYNFNSRQLEKLKLDRLRITFSASNIWYRAINFPKYVNFDPNNSRGSGAINVPSNRRFSLTLSTRF